MRPRIAPALICASLTVLLAACGGNDGPAPDATSTGVPIPTATPFASLPAPVIVTAVAGPSAGGDLTYIVEPGDSLSAIAARFGTTVEAITEANDLADADIIVGQELLIPGGSAPAAAGGATGTPAPTTAPATSDVYVVESGDTALGIAISHGVTLEQLAAANGMTVDQITDLKIGQELQIPR
ncbi:MAG: LysM peptidoglycan-binding domain-containing protein [Chloroflexi bacterium]|nr:LysM peptidoglycan-binding domain-containing protein [Chloroflexota bacterium]MDA1002687.1 LysM peptidoglycan-binding domain-containing protein [Chloroflexota bacterium]